MALNYLYLVIGEIKVNNIKWIMNDDCTIDKIW